MELPHSYKVAKKYSRTLVFKQKRNDRLISEGIVQSGAQEFEIELLQTNGRKFIADLCQSEIVVIKHNLIIGSICSAGYKV